MLRSNRYRRSLGLIPESGDAPSFKDRRQYMVELEGYATYIERDFIRKEHYRMAISDYHSSAADTIVTSKANSGDRSVGGIDNSPLIFASK